MSTNNTKVNKYEIILNCYVCECEIIEDSDEHDECILANDGDDLVCGDCCGSGDCCYCIECDSYMTEDFINNGGGVWIYLEQRSDLYCEYCYEYKQIEAAKIIQRWYTKKDNIFKTKIKELISWKKICRI
tara:strand:+ start:268 stop:657 length:390 start_codon:yes stop_codon:yes gene_type:complete